MHVVRHPDRLAKRKLAESWSPGPKRSWWGGTCRTARRLAADIVEILAEVFERCSDPCVEIL